MSTYHFDFIGREVNAIGITYPISAAVRAENYDAAVLKLYDKFEHIRITHWSEWPDAGPRVNFEKDTSC